MGFFKLFAVSAVVMCLAHTIAREKIGEPIRRRLGGRDTWLGYLVSCPYCLSHWMAFLLVPLTGSYYVQVVPRWGFFSSVLDWLLSSILVVAIAAFLRVAFYFVDGSQGLVRKQQELVKAEMEERESTSSPPEETPHEVPPRARIPEQPLPHHHH